MKKIRLSKHEVEMLKLILKHDIEKSQHFNKKHKSDGVIITVRGILSKLK